MFKISLSIVYIYMSHWYSNMQNLNPKKILVFQSDISSANQNTTRPYLNASQTNAGQHKKYILRLCVYSVWVGKQTEIIIVTKYCYSNHVNGFSIIIIMFNLNVRIHDKNCSKVKRTIQFCIFYKRYIYVRNINIYFV